MAKQTINIGSTANDGTGDPLRTAFNKANENFTEIYDIANSAFAQANTGGGLTANSVATFTNKTLNVSVASNNTFSIQGQSITSYSGSGSVVLLQDIPTINALNVHNSNITLDGGSGSYYWSGQTGVAQAGDYKAGFYSSDPSSNNGLFTFGTNGTNNMSVSVEGSLFVGSAKPSNDGGVTTAFGGWLVVQNGGKFGAGIDTLGSALVGHGIQEKFSTKADATGVVEHDCSTGQIFYHTSPDANWTANFTNLNITQSYGTTLTLVVDQGATGYYANAIQIGGVSQTINWQANTLPTPSSNRKDVISFSVLNNGGTYIVLGQLTGF